MTNLDIIGLQEQLVKIDDQIFELAEKYEWKSLDSVVRGWVVMSERENREKSLPKPRIIYQD